MGRDRLGSCYSQPGPGFKTNPVCARPASMARPGMPLSGASGPWVRADQSPRFTVVVVLAVTVAGWTVEVAVVVVPSVFRVFRTAWTL